MTTQLASPLYQIDGWTGNATDDYGVDWVVTGETGWSSGAPVRRDSTPREYDDGDWDQPQYLSGRLVTLEGVAAAPDQTAQNTAKDRLLAVCTGRDLTALTVTEKHLARTAQVRLAADTKITDVGPLGFRWSLALYAPDPRRYATAETVGSVALVTDATIGGRTYPRHYPLTYTGTGATGTYLAVNAGTYQTLPVLTIYGAITNPSVEHVPSGRTLTVNLALGATDYVVLDRSTKTVVLNGSADRTGSLPFDAAWFELDRGTTQLKFRGTAGTGGAQRLDVAYTSAWI